MIIAEWAPKPYFNYCEAPILPRVVLKSTRHCLFSSLHLRHCSLLITKWLQFGVLLSGYRASRVWRVSDLIMSAGVL